MIGTDSRHVPSKKKAGTILRQKALMDKRGLFFLMVKVTGHQEIALVMDLYVWKVKTAQKQKLLADKRISKIERLLAHRKSE